MNTTAQRLSDQHDADVTITASLPTGSTSPADDLHTRWTPSAEQSAAAAFAFTTYPAEQRDDLTYIVPLALVGKVQSVWTTDVTVEAVEGIASMAWTGPGDAPEFTANYHAGCDRMARIALDALDGRTGTASYATINADGTWAVWEAFWL